MLMPNISQVCFPDWHSYCILWTRVGEFLLYPFISGM